jgi:hypothetical protein
VEDVQWHIRALAKLEERVEVMQEEKATALTELGLLEKSFERVGEACWGPSYSPLHKIELRFDDKGNSADLWSDASPEHASSKTFGRSTIKSEPWSKTLAAP